MYSLFNSSSQSLSSRSGHAERRHRNSIDRHSLQPLLPDHGTDERRYYRSAEFQQALVEHQMQRTQTPPLPPSPATEQTRHRLSRYSFRRQSTAGSRSSTSLVMLDGATSPEDGHREDSEQRGQLGSEPDVQSSPYSALVPTQRRPPATTAGSNHSSVSEQRPTSKHLVPRIHLNDVAPLLKRMRHIRKF
ncbi:hypothetical protein CERZMDRAFT_99345 [Cercospora zeae-maydis SCOH1-5]|uniref:Uncharacterized protein n=1 Tax=Cercospora zeae-maydis SCOH1-5 TaxID=717836 RepID=A0A6A6FBH3_9PEZI|nr:hypothetical protein CERZMDRAFT_99345 [Cercospora zeae-maydis SCOH1-5]